MLEGRTNPYVLDHVVGNTNGAGLALGELGHGSPGVDNGDLVADGNVTALDAAVLNQREVVVAAGEGDGPVDQVELGLLAIAEPQGVSVSYIEVVELELSKTLVQGLLDIVGVVLAMGG